MDYSRRRRRRTLTLSVPNIFTLGKLFKYAFFAAIAFTIIGFATVLWFSRDLPTPGKLSPANLSESTKIYDRAGKVLYDIFQQQNRTYVELDKIPKYVQEATIAIEDKDFYQNQGFSIMGYLRIIRNLIIGQGLSGGSTLTQQLVKNTLLSPERTPTRKIKEFILAVQVDKRYTKDQILELYLNVAPYGGSAVGVEAASEYYFGKKAKDLNLAESAILAGLPQLPSYYNPYGEHPKAYIDRTTEVLRRMREDGYITQSLEQATVKSLPKVKFVPQKHSIKAPHFSFHVKNLLEKQFGQSYVQKGGLQVTTSLDYKLQEKAEQIVREEVDNAKNLNVGNGASIVLDPQSGEILAMVGSKDFFATDTGGKDKTQFDGQFNVITQALRQPGSSIKPVTYATALEKGYTASTMIMDVKTVFANPDGKDYIPVNYDGKFNGPMHLRFALGNSINIPAVKLLALVGVKNMMTTAYKMGLLSLEPTTENVNRFGLSLTLGGGDVKPIELALAFSAFANEGYKVEPVAILKVTDSKGNVLYEKKDTQKEKVLSPEVAFIISHILLDNNARQLTFGSNSYLNIAGRTVGVKTGTTDDKRDNWTVGWTPNILVLTWVGNNDNSPMNPRLASGVTGAAPIWRRIIIEGLKGKPNLDFKKPDNVVAVTIDGLGGGLPVDGQPTRSEYFIKGTEPQGPASIYKEVKVSKSDNNKLASPSEKDTGQYDTKKFIVFHEDDPVSSDEKNRWQEGILEWVNEKYKDNPLYHPPTETSDRKVEDKKEEKKPDPTQTPGPTASPTPAPSPTPTP